MKKGLAVIINPQSLSEFIWYYSTYGYEKEWDALCLTDGVSFEQIIKKCNQSGMFSKVLSCEKVYEDDSVAKRIMRFLKMLFYACIGKRNIFCNKLIASLVNINDYDEVSVEGDLKTVTGSFISLAKSGIFNVSIFEDGTIDYLDRKYSNIKHNRIRFGEVMCFFMAIMGYSNPNGKYPLRTTKNCVKYSSRPEKMIYRDYKAINQLYDFEKTNKNIFERIISATYGDVSNLQNGEYDVILFTTPLSDFDTDYQKYQKKTVEYLDNNYKSIIVKKHPRDTSQYAFNNSIEISPDIPYEVLIPFLKCNSLVFMYPSSVLLNIQNLEELDIVFLYYSELEQNSNKYNSTMFEKTIELFDIVNPKIVKLE